MKRHEHCLVTLLLVGACATTPALSERPEIAVEFLAPAEATLGDTAELQLRIYSRSEKNRTLSLWAGGGFAFDPIVRSLDGTKVWQRSDNLEIASAALHTSFRKGDTGYFAAKWPLVNGANRQLVPGTYELVAVLKDAKGESLIGYSHTRRIRVVGR
jgi:hypothetical protein